MVSSTLSVLSTQHTNTPSCDERNRQCRSAHMSSATCCWTLWKPSCPLASWCGNGHLIMALQIVVATHGSIPSAYDSSAEDRLGLPRHRG